MARALDTSNEDHFAHVGAYRDVIEASYPDRPGDHGQLFGLWVAIITIQATESGSAVTSELLQSVENDGVLKNSDEYLGFLDALAAQLADLDQRAS